MSVFLKYVAIDLTMTLAKITQLKSIEIKKDIIYLSYYRTDTKYTVYNKHLDFCALWF